MGNADPRALSLAVAAMHATEMIGLPEAQYALAQAAAYVASAPKSNRAGAAYFAALAEVEENGRLPVPLHLRPSAHRRLAREHGYGKGYLYPHDYDDADVDQQYLPDALAGRVFYEPSDEGLELKIGERLQRLRRNSAGGEPALRGRGGGTSRWRPSAVPMGLRAGRIGEPSQGGDSSCRSRSDVRQAGRDPLGLSSCSRGSRRLSMQQLTATAIAVGFDRQRTASDRPLVRTDAGQPQVIERPKHVVV